LDFQARQSMGGIGNLISLGR
jgi:peptide chain release factor 1